MKGLKNILIVNDLKKFVFGFAEAVVYGFDRRRKQKFIMLFTINK